MDGKEYLACFTDVDTIPVVGDEENLGEVLELAIDHSLAHKLYLLYATGEIHFLDDRLVPQVVIEADQSIRDDHLTQIAEVDMMGIKAMAMRRQGLRVVTDLPSPGRRRDDSEQMSVEELELQTENEHRRVTSSLTVYSDTLFSHILLGISRMGQRREITPLGSADVVRQAITTSRRELYQRMNGWRGIVSVERDFELNISGVTRREVDMRVFVDRTGVRHVPKWLPKAKEWETQLHRLCSTITEFETLVALQEWVIARRLPLVPLIAPRSCEDGAVVSYDEGNPHADLLLCNVLPRHNVIIPIQNKNTVSDMVRKRTHPGVVLVGAENITPIELSTVIVRNSRGAMKTGHRTTARYGQLFEHFYVNRLNGVGGKQVSRAQRQAFETALEVPFGHFDREILPLLPFQKQM